MRYNWSQIKADYVEAPDEASRPTLEELAAKYGCNAGYLRKKAADGNWLVQAERFLAATEDRRKEQKSTAIAGTLAQWDANCYTVAQGGMKQVFAHLKIGHEKLEAGQDPLSIRTLNELSMALERFQRIGHRALGDNEERVKLKIDFAKLSDEQLERIAAGENPRNVLA